MPSKEIEDKDLKDFEGTEGIKGTSGAVDTAADIAKLVEEESSKDATSVGGMDRMRERATSKAMGKPAFEDKDGDYFDIDGDGGYKYRWTRDGSIRILKAPNGRGEGLTLTSGKAYDAIKAEIAAKGGRAPDGEGAGGMDWTFPMPAEGGGKADKNGDGVLDVKDLAKGSVQEARGDASREVAQRNAQVATTVEKGKLDTKMAMEEKTRDTAQHMAKTGTRLALSQSDDPDAVLTSARAEADRLMKEGKASEAISVLNDAIEKAKELRSQPQDDGDVVARAVKSRRESMGI
jgi:hypothetical protein